MEADEINNAIPPFNPNSSLSLNSEEWIDEVENVSALRSWTDEQTLMYASLRLEDDANLWFCTNQWNNWQQFKLRLVRQFPSSHHRSQYLEKLLKRHKEEAETYEEYVRDIVQMAKNCNFNLPTAISYIISGLSDANMRNRLIAYNCTSISEVLSRIQTITFNQEQKAKNSEDKQKSPPKKPPPVKVKVEVKAEPNPDYPPFVDKAEWSDLVMTVKLADIFVTAFADLSNKYTTLQLSEFQKHSWKKMRQCDLKVLAFRNGISKVLGKIRRVVIAGQVEMLIEILVVEDNIQNYPLILGRNFLHNPNVCIIKSFQNFEVNFVDTPLTSPTPIPNPYPTNALSVNKKKKKKRSRNKSKQKQINDVSSFKEIQKINKEGRTFIKEIIVTVREEKPQIMN